MQRLIIVLIVLFTAGCTGKQSHILTSEIVETSENSEKPQWLFKTFRVLKNEAGFEFSGGVMNVSDYALGVSEARAEAIKNGISSIQLKVRSEFSRFAEGSNMTPDLIGKFVSDGIAYVADSFYVTGIQQREIFYEKAIYSTDIQPHYNIWARCYISKPDYMKAKIDAAQRLVNKYKYEKNMEAKKKAEELLERLRKEASS